MRILTATDFLGIKTSPLPGETHGLVCPWCGEDAWAVSDYFQCFNSGCVAQAASAEDIIAKALGGYKKVEPFVAKRSNVAVKKYREAERLVMDTWVGFCLTPPTSVAIQVSNRMHSKGFGIAHSRFNAIVLNMEQMKKLVHVADLTGAEFPDHWINQPPGVSRAFCIQTRPHTIDRIVIMSGTGKVEEIIWNRYTAGFCSLIGLSPDSPRLVAADIDTAMKIQHELASMGKLEEVSCVHVDLWRGEPCPRWDIQKLHLLTAVPRHCRSQPDPGLFNTGDVVRIQQTLDQFPGVAGSVKALPIDHVLALHSREDAIAWSNMRFALICSMIPDHATQVPEACASIFEQTGTRNEDAVSLTNYFKGEHRDQIAHDIELLSLTRIITRDRQSVIKETATDYRVIRGADTITLSNFSLRIHSSVTFKHHRADRYCQGVIRCGRAAMEVLFPQNLLHDRVQSLESELQRQLTVADKVAEAGHMPTVIEVSKFRNFIVPHLRNQAANAKPIRGVDLLGWSEDRKSFTFPGFIATPDGTSSTSHILCPSVVALARFKASPLSEWAESCPRGLDRSCRDLVAILVAACVRYFRRSPSRPVMIAQSSATLTALEKIMEAFGQQEIHPLNSNDREGSRIDGIHGYPLLAAGPRNVIPGTTNQLPYLLLTDQGYKLPTEPTRDQAVAAARAAQYCIRKVVDWCLTTGGDEFRESPALEHHRSLLREGHWLIQEACGIPEWETSFSESTALEELLAQIPYEEAGRRMTLIDGTDLVIDVRGLDRNHDGILREARDMGTLAAIEDDKIMSSAVKLLPAISVYYGQDPDVTLITN